MELNNEYNLQVNGSSPCNANPSFVESLCKVNRSVSKCEPYDCNGLGQRSNCSIITTTSIQPGFPREPLEKAFQPEKVKEMNYVDYAAIPGRMATVVDNSRVNLRN